MTCFQATSFQYTAAAEPALLLYFEHGFKVIIRDIKCAITSSAAILAFLSLGSAVAAGPDPAAIAALKAAPDAMSAVKLSRGNGAIFCTLGKNDNGKITVDVDRAAVLYAPEFRAWHGRGEVTQYAEAYSNIGGILASMQRGICNLAVESAPNMLALLAELEQDGMRVSILPSPLRPAQLANAYANSLGFASNDDLQLATHMKANNTELQAYFKLGITSKAAYDDAVARMLASGYSRNPLDLPYFLKDEAEGTRRNLSASMIREERLSSSPPH